jgi:hypothetical protein
MTHETWALVFIPPPLTVTRNVWWPLDSLASFALVDPQGVPRPSIVHALEMMVPVSVYLTVGLRLARDGLPRITTSTVASLGGGCRLAGAAAVKVTLAPGAEGLGDEAGASAVGVGMVAVAGEVAAVAPPKLWAVTSTSSAPMTSAPLTA